jgi:uncharacterized delta-60 repeat protein
VAGLCPGALDPAFGDGGVSFPVLAADGELFDVDVDGAGRVVAVGRVRRADAGDLLVVRLTFAGAPDPAFGGGGFIESDLGGTERGHAVRFDPVTDRIQIAGLSQGPQDGTPALWTLADDGTFDAPVGGGPARLFPRGAHGAFWRVEPAEDGGAWLAGDAVEGGLRRPFLVRLSGDLTPSQVFGGGVDARPGWSPGDARARGLAVLVDGTVLFGGDVQAGATDSWHAARYDGAGASIFDGPIGALVPPEPTAFHLHALVPAGQGFVGVGERLTPDGHRQGVVQRFLADGTPDAAFGAGGIAPVPVAPVLPDAPRDTARAVAVGPDGAILVAAGERVGGHDRVVLLRLAANGALDPTFGDAGRVILELGEIGGFGEGDARVTGLRLTPGGRAIAVGTFRSADVDRPFVVRFGF